MQLQNLEVCWLGNCYFFTDLCIEVSHLTDYFEKKKIDAAKSEVLELDNLGFMEDVSSSVSNLLSSPSKEIKCVESIVFSSFNPPPSYRRSFPMFLYEEI